MKTFSLIFLCLIAFVQTTFAQYGNSRGILNTNFGTNPPWVGRTCDFTEGNCGGTINNAYVGVIPATLDGTANTPFYCLDLCTPISPGDTVRDSSSSIPQAIYLMQNYYPHRTSYTGKLSNNNDEAAAIQFAIWHFRNNLDVSLITDISGSLNLTVFKNRVNAIIADVNANGGSAVQLSTIKIKPAVDPDKFYIETKDTAGNGISVSNIQLSITGGGSLSTNTVNTNTGGISPDVTVSGASNGSIIQASGTVDVPGGTTYSGLTQVLQLLVLAKTTTANRTDEISWGALPVELSSFVSYVNNRTVDLMWKTSSEENNAGFDIERKMSGTDNWAAVGHITGAGTTNTAREYFFTDRNLESGTYNYRLKQIDFNGNYEYHYLSSDVLVGTPMNFNLSQNYPNPFNPATKINFQLANDGNVSIEVFNNLGKKVADVLNEYRPAGYYTAEFNASALPSGSYFYKMTSGSFSKVMRMVVIK